MLFRSVEIAQSFPPAAHRFLVFASEANVGSLGREMRRYAAACRADGKRFARTRAITGLDRNVRLNKELWSLAQRLANGEALSFAE